MTSTNSIQLYLNNVSLSFVAPDNASPLKILDGVTLSVNQGEFVSLVGPSGCGKTTLLNVIAGFAPYVKEAEGEIIYEGEKIKRPSPQRAVVFQFPVLFPWLTVKENVAYGLKQAKIAKEEIEKTVAAHIELVGLKGFENYYPEKLSGGMQQRVALARVLVLKPQLLLMDEPFAALDAQIRFDMQQLLLSICEKFKVTVLFVTHDVEEALYLSDKIYIMSKRPGRIIKELEVPFARPRDLSLIGTPNFAFLKAEILNLIMKEVKEEQSLSLKDG